MIKEYGGTLYGTYRTKKFSDVWSDVNSFLADYQNNGIPQAIPATGDENTQGNATTLFYLLYARYGNDIVASSDLTRFKYQLFSIIWQYGPTWVKELDLQYELRTLTEEELETGNTQIYNKASNPSTDPTTNTTDYLQYVNDQNVTHNKKGKIESLVTLEAMLKKDVTEEFLGRFKKLFLTFIEPELPLLYPEINEGGN